ncbi:hypothetical protein EDB89DRAFT_1962930 [Lactarius sanguifluus]|nr:hypothetical protein EDB89DRAFT_1962930 [Lactarius sanguifluus]
MPLLTSPKNHGAFSFASMNITGTGLGRELGSPEFWSKMLICTCLVLLGGVLAGYPYLHLRVLSTSSENEKERKDAAEVLKLLDKGRHWVLVVLLLGNVIVNESLPIFLDSAIGGGVAAIVISTTMIVIFGIIPQAVSVRHGLSIGARCVPVVLILMYFFAPRLTVLGKSDVHTYKKAELKSFLQFHRTGEEPLRDDEISILNGVLELNTKRIEKIMTPMKDVVTLSSDTILDAKMIESLLFSGYSRLPVHEPGNPLAFLGLLLVKKVMPGIVSASLTAAHLRPITMLARVKVRPVDSSRSKTDHQRLPGTRLLVRSLSVFGRLLDSHPVAHCSQTGRAHLLLISNTPGISGGAIGVITLEGTSQFKYEELAPVSITDHTDIIEEIIAEEIVDETDRYEDNKSKRQAKRMTTTAVMRG